MSMLSAAGVTAAGTLQFLKGWQGPWDTRLGWTPVTTESALCAPNAEPMIAAGPVKLPDANPPQPFVRVMQNWNFTDHDYNFNWIHSVELTDFFAGLDLSGSSVSNASQIIYDHPAGDPNGYRGRPCAGEDLARAADGHHRVSAGRNAALRVLYIARGDARYCKG